MGTATLTPVPNAGTTGEHQFVPLPAASLEEAGVSESLVEQLILKNLHYRGEISGRDLAKTIGLQFSVIEPVIDFLKQERLLETKRATGFGTVSSVFAVSETGRVRAKEYLENNQFLGPTPVPLRTYTAAVAAQALEPGWMTREHLRARHRLSQAGEAARDETRDWFWNRLERVCGLGDRSGSRKRISREQPISRPRTGPVAHLHRGGSGAGARTGLDDPRALKSD